MGIIRRQKGSEIINNWVFYRRIRFLRTSLRSLKITEINGRRTYWISAIRILGKIRRKKGLGKKQSDWTRKWTKYFHWRNRSETFFRKVLSGFAVTDLRAMLRSLLSKRVAERRVAKIAKIDVEHKSWTGGELWRETNRLKERL